mgnify:FL=1
MIAISNDIVWENLTKLAYPFDMYGFTKKAARKPMTLVIERLFVLLKAI